MMKKERFNIDRFMSRLKAAYTRWDAPSITLLSNGGASPFELLISTVLSARTKDEVTIEASRRLFRKARTPAEMVELDAAVVERLIYPVGFYRTKAVRAHSSRVIAWF